MGASGWMEVHEEEKDDEEDARAVAVDRLGIPEVDTREKAARHDRRSMSEKGRGDTSPHKNRDGRFLREFGWW